MTNIIILLSLAAACLAVYALTKIIYGDKNNG